MRRAARAACAVLLLASVAACGPRPGSDAAGSADRTVADSVRRDSLRRDSIIGRDSAFGPTQTIDAKGKVGPIRPPPR